mgnify:CR=1 FL=1
MTRLAIFTAQHRSSYSVAFMDAGLPPERALKQISLIDGFPIEQLPLAATRQCAGER